MKMTKYFEKVYFQERLFMIQQDLSYYTLSSQIASAQYWQDGKTYNYQHYNRIEYIRGTNLQNVKIECEIMTAIYINVVIENNNVDCLLFAMIYVEIDMI